MKIIKHNVEQQSEEWFKLRGLKMTGSNAQAIGNAGSGLKTYIRQLIAEKYSTAEKERYSNKDMERGNELEPVARMVYEFTKSIKVETIGFITINSDEEIYKYSGVSPDGLINKDGGLEIKCPNDIEYLRILIDGEDGIKSDYIWQIQYCLLFTKRKWWDLMLYNPNFKKSYIIFKIYPDKEKHKKILEGLKLGVKMIKKLENKLK